MRIRAAEPERGDRGAAGAGVRRPRGVLDRYEQPGRCRVNSRIPLGKMQIRRYLATLHGQYRLDEAGHAGRGLEMADVGFHRAQRATALAAPIGGGQRLELDWVTESRSGAVAFDVMHAVRGDVGRAQRVGDHVALRGSVGRGDAVGAAVLVDRRTAYHRKHRIAVAHRVGQPLEHHHARTLTPHETVRRRVEGGAATMRREQSPGGDGDLGLRAQGHADPTGQRQIAFAGPQALAGQVDRGQRRRAGRVDGHGWAPQSQQVGDAARGDAVRVPGSGVGVHAVRAARDHGLVFVEVGAHHHGSPSAAEGIRGDPGMFEGFPGDLEQHPLLRIHRCRLPGSDAEELGVEARDVGDKAAPLRRHMAGGQWIGVIEGLGIPAVGRDVGDGVAPFDHQLPKGFRAGHVAGESAAHADDRDRFGHGGSRGPGELVGQGRALLRCQCEDAAGHTSH